jgi:hypothetical protein
MRFRVVGNFVRLTRATSLLKTTTEARVNLFMVHFSLQVFVSIIHHQKGSFPPLNTYLLN